MSTVIDERVVELRFDNKQFERETKTSLSTLQRLKEALKFSKSTDSIKVLERTASNMKLDGAIASVRALENRFSALGVVGMRVIQNLTDSVMNQFNKAVGFVSDSIVSGGVRRSMNIENAHFQLQALLKDEEKVQAVMDNAMDSVDGTAYAYDEAAKAASMFAATGLEAGEEMERALKGITGVAAMTNSEYSSISEIFTTVAGQGRLMGDQLLQLASRGLNAASTIKDFFNGVNAGTVNTTDDIKETIAELTNGLDVTEGEIRDFVSNGQISFQTFAEAMNNAFGDSAKRANETFTGSFANLKSALARIGAGFFSPLIVQNGAVVELFNTLRERVDDIKKELVFDEAIGNTNALSKAFTDSVIAMAKSVTKFVKEADISGPIKILYNNVAIIHNLLNGLGSVLPGIGKAFNRVFDFKFSNLVDLSETLKKVTEGFHLTEQGTIVVRRIFQKLFKVVNTLITGFKELYPAIFKINNTTKILRIFNRSLKAVLNVAKGVISVIKPIGQAFVDSFGVLGKLELGDFLDLLKEAAQKLVDFTENLRLTEASQQALRDGFKGIFDVINLVVTAFLRLFGVVTPIAGPVNTLVGSLLQLFGMLGRVVSAIVEFVSQNSALNTIFSLLANGFKSVISVVSSFLEYILDFDNIKTILEGIGAAIVAMYNLAEPKIQSLMDVLGQFKDKLLDIIPDSMADGINWLINLFKDLGNAIGEFATTGSTAGLEKITSSIKSMIDLARENASFSTFVDGFLEFLSNLKSGLSADNVSDKISGLSSTFKTFVTWVKETFVPAMGDLSAADALAAGTTFGGIYSLIKVAKSINNVTSMIDTIPKVIENLGDAIKSYQTNLKARTILAIAAAIGVLAGALVLVSFTDTDKLWQGAKSIAAVGAILVAAVATIAMMKYIAMKKGLDQVDGALNKAAKSFVSFSDMLKGISVKIANYFAELFGIGGGSIGKTILKIGASFALISKSIVDLATAYKENKDGVTGAIKILGGIAGVFTGLVVVFGLLDKVLKGGGAESAGKTVKAFATSMLLAVIALKKLMNMKIPSDYAEKLTIFAGVFLGLGAVVTALEVFGRLGGGNEGPAKTIMAFATSLILCVSALKKLFKINLPSDYGEKVAILVGIMGSLALVMIAMAAAARISGGAIKAGGTITAMAAFVSAAALALSGLALIKGEKLLNGAKALGLVIAALAVPILAASKIDGEGAAPAVKAMGTVIASIATTLGILALISWEPLRNAVIALDAVLLGLTATFAGLGKVNNKKAYVSVFAMIAMLVSISYSLYKLSEQPWDSMLASGIAMAAVLVAFTAAFKTMSSASSIKIETIEYFLLATLAVVPIGAALYVLATQPWDGMLAAGVALSATVLAFSKAYNIIAESSTVDVATIGKFLLLTLAVVPIGAALYVLAEQPWDGMLAAAASLSLTILALAEVTNILSKIGEGGSIVGALKGIAMMDILIADLAAVMIALGALFQNEALKDLMNNGFDALADMGKGIGKFIGSIVGGIAAGVMSGLEDIGEYLSSFMEKAKPFFDGLDDIDKDTMQSVAYLTSALKDLASANFLNKFTGKQSLDTLAEQLPGFGTHIKEFADNVSGMSTDSVDAAASAAKTMAEVSKNLPYSDESLMGKIFGKKSLSQFAEELVLFGPSIAAFAITVQGVKEKHVKGAAAAAELMTKVASGLSYDSESFFGKLFGKKSLTQFAEELDNFAPSIVSFAEHVQGVKEKHVKGAAAAAELMTTLYKNLPFADESFAAKLFGTKNISDFGEELDNFAPSIVDFANKVKDVKPEAVEGAASVAKTMATIANELPNEGGVVSWFTGDNSMKKFGENLEAFGEAFKKFCDTMSEIGAERVSTINAKIIELLEALNNKGTDGVKKFVSAFKNSDAEVVSGINTMIDYATDALKNKNSVFEDNGKVFAQNLITGMNSQQYYLKDAGDNMVSVVINGITDVIVNIKEAGRLAAQGFAEGITENTNLAYNAGTALGNAAYNAARAALDEHSPSRKMGEVGKFGAMGFINEFITYIPKAMEAGEDLATSALKGVTDGSSRIVSFIDSNWNMDPVITPRIDMSDIESNAGIINSMFNDSVYSAKMQANVVAGAMNSYQEAKRQTSTYDALSKLSDLIPSLVGGGDTYNLNGLSYSESSDVAAAIQTLVRATNLKRRV